VTKGTKRQHPDPERLDAYAGGDHSRRDVRDHVAGCPVCAETVASLRRVRGELARLAEVTMPDEMIRRLRALAPPTGPAGPPEPAGPPGATGRASRPNHGGPEQRATAGAGPSEPWYRSGTGPDAGADGDADGRDRRLRSPRERTAGRRPRRRRHPDHSDPADRPGRSDRPLSLGLGRGASGFVPVRPQARRRAGGGPPPGGGHDSGGGLLALAAALLVVVAIGGAVLSRGGAARIGADSVTTASAGLTGGPTPAGRLAAPARTEDDAPAPATGLVSVARTGAALDARNVADHGVALVAGRPRPLATVAVTAALTGAVPAGLSAPARTALTALTGPGLVRCYEIIMGRYGGRLLAIDEVVYQKAPAALLVLTVPDDDQELRVLVLDRSCAAADVSEALWYGAVTSND
jgi:hypothetical protein